MTVARIRRSPGGRDAYGDPVTSTEAREVIDGAFVAPRTSSPVDQPGRDGVVVGLTLFAPLDADVLRTDLFEVDGDEELWRVVGEIGRWEQPQTGWGAGLTAALERAAG